MAKVLFDLGLLPKQIAAAGAGAQSFSDQHQADSDFSSRTVSVEVQHRGGVILVEAQLMVADILQTTIQIIVRLKDAVISTSDAIRTRSSQATTCAKPTLLPVEFRDARWRTANAAKI